MTKLKAKVSLELTSHTHRDKIRASRALTRLTALIDLDVASYTYNNLEVAVDKPKPKVQEELCEV